MNPRVRRINKVTNLLDINGVIRFMKFLIVLIAIASFPAFSSNYQGEISDTKMIYRLYDENPYISTIGYIKNDSEYSLEDISIEVRYFDDKGNIIDSAFENIYALVVPPDEKVSFKIQTTAIDDKNNYASHKAYIISSTQNIPGKNNFNNRGSSNNYGSLKKIFISWFPLLLLILVWIFFVKRYSGKGSNQYKLVELMEKQVEYDEVRNKEISSIAKSLRTKRENERSSTNKDN